MLTFYDIYIQHTDFPRMLKCPRNFSSVHLITPINLVGLRTVTIYVMQHSEIGSDCPSQVFVQCIDCTHANCLGTEMKNGFYVKLRHCVCRSREVTAIL